MNSYIRTFAEVNLDAIEHNFNELKSCVNDNVKLCAVIKADGYGHGAVTLAELLKDKADYFAVATVDEAVELRNAGVMLPILILSYVHPDDFEAVINNEIAITCFSKENALKYNETAKSLNKKGLMHIAIDTGMTRIGFALNDESVCDIKDIFDLENITICGVFSHYACADMTDKSTSKMQTERYKAFVKKCEDKGVVFPIHHLCNSAGISEFNEHFDMVRMGISLYGLYPSDEVDMEKVKLIPAMTFKSHITHIKDVPAGEGISYGHIYKTTETRKIATVSAGYADGYPRALSNRGRVLVCGKFAPIVGRVCMDQFMIDVTDIPEAKVDDEVILFGSDGVNAVPAEEIGALSMSFNYEVVCAVARRIPRVYIKNGEKIKTINYLR